MNCIYCDIEQMCESLPVIFNICTILAVLVISAVILIIKAVVFCKIFSKAGYHWALGLLMLVPIACIIMPFILAFGQWPIYKELQQLRRQQNKTGS